MGFPPLRVGKNRQARIAASIGLSVSGEPAVSSATWVTYPSLLIPTFAARFAWAGGIFE